MKSKKLFLLGVFLLTALLTLLGSPLFAFYDYNITGIQMVEIDEKRDRYRQDKRFPFNDKTRTYDEPTLEVAPGGSISFCFIVDKLNDAHYNPRMFSPKLFFADTTEKLQPLKYRLFDVNGATFGPAMPFNLSSQAGNSITLRDPIVSVPIFFWSAKAGQHAIFAIDVSENAPVAETYSFEVTALPVGEAGDAFARRKFKIQVKGNRDKATISGDTSITLNQGNTVSFELTGTNTKSWYCDTTQALLDQAGLDYIKLNPVKDDSGLAPKCEVSVQANTEVLSGGSATSEWTIRAANPYGVETSHNLKITVNSTPDTSDTKIVSYSPSQTIEVKQGRTAAVTLIGDDNVRSWYYDNELSGDFDDILLSFDEANPKICTAHVYVKPDARVMTHEAKIYVFNGAGKRGTTPGKLNITVTPDEDRMKPIIDNTEEEVTVVQGGVATVTFTGKYAKSWLASRYGSEYFTSKLSTKLDFSKNPNRCDFQVIADKDSPVGTYDLYLYAINAAGQRSERAKLTVHVVASAEHTSATIDTNETIFVVPGQEAMATFTGKHVRSWTVDQSDVSKYAWIDAIECSYADNPDRCDMIVITNTSADVGVSKAEINVYAYNLVGTQSDPATLTIIAANPDDFKNPVIDTSESVSVVAGGTAKAVFTGQHIRRWNYNANFSDDIHGIELNYSSNPNRCEVLVTADAKAKAGTYPVTIYAYNAVGEETSANLTVTITAEEAKYDDPVIDENEEVSVIAGGTAKAVFTGQHIRAWKYGLLPDIVKAVELKYDVNPNRCEVLVTASSTATGSSKVTIYAYNEVGEETSADLTVKITEEATKYELPTIDENEEVSVIAGGTAKAVFTGQHIRAWRHGNLPGAVKAVELNYSSNPNRCEVLVTASSTATAGTYTVTIYAYNEVGEETSAELSVTITEEETKYAAPTIDEGKTVSVIAGGTAKAQFTGKNVKSWKHGNLPDAVKAVELDYAKNSNVCNVLVTAGSNATAGTYTVTMYAYNEVGSETSADLTVTVTTEPTVEKAVISTTAASVSVVAGGTAQVKLSGTNVRAWIYWNLPDAIKAVELDYGSDPNICEVFVTAGSNAEAGTVSFDVYAYNEVGEEAATPATITVTITASGSDTDTKPKLTTAPASVELVPDGKTTLTFMGENISFWKYEDSSYLLAEVDLNYSTNANVCTVKLTANDFAVEGLSDDIRIVAYNTKGESVSATLVINIVKDDNVPTINVPAEKDQFKSVVPGGTVKAVISGNDDITTWSYEKGTSSVVEKVKLDNTTTPSLNICNVIITVSSTATVSSVTSAAGEWLNIYAYNSKGNWNKYPMPIGIDVVAPSAEKAPTIAGDQSVTVAPGESVSATFTGTKVVDWEIPALTELATTDFTSITQNYDRDGNPNSNTVTVEAASAAKSGEHTVTVYAYGEDGQTASADLKVTVSSSSSGSGGSGGSIGGAVGSSNVGGCDMGFAGLGVLALALTLMKKYSN